MSQGRWIGRRDEEGRYHGVGSLILPNGDMYQGPMVHGMKHGDGAIFREILPPASAGGSAGSKQYQGPFRDDQKHGQGTMNYSNGDYFRGTFENGVENGDGTFQTTLWGASGTYEANWVNGKIHGPGTFRNRRRFRGLIGTFHFPGFENGAPTDFTSITYCNGNYYVGEIDNWLWNGAGKYTSFFRDGTKDEKEGNFLNSDLHGKGTWTRTSPDGASYVAYDGDWENGQRHGKGTAEMSNGDRYVGDYRNGARNGEGVYTTAGGTTYTGQWADGRQVGPHEIRLASGFTFTSNYGAASSL